MHVSDYYFYLYLLFTCTYTYLKSGSVSFNTFLLTRYKTQDTLFSKSGGHDTTFIISTYTINTSASIKLSIDLQGFYMYGSSSFYMYR